MPNYPKLELHATDSRLLGSLDSASLPSEPPDIRNWFASYVYESNTLHDFQDFGASAGIFIEGEKKAKLDDNQVVDKVNDGLHAGKMESLDGIVKCNESDELEHSRHADVVSGLFDSHSLLLSSVSEPPDIRNWFSSYLYETPMLDTTDGFTFSDYKEDKESKACNAELASHSRISEVVVKSIDLVKGSKQTYQTGSMDGQKLERNQIPHVPNELASERISQPEQKAQACCHHSVEEYINKNIDGRENNVKSDTTFMRRTTQSHTVVHVENYTGGQEGKYLPLIQTKNNSENSLSNNRDFGKENLETALPENGFVCTRNSGEPADIESFTKPQRVQFQPLRKGVKHGSNRVENTDTRRNVLSETTNLPLTNAPEIMGKWRCPQRNKPNRGPPFKQVRLEQWVRRV